MAKYICQNPKCKCEYEYCRGCLLSPIPYKSMGFCSQKCADEFKNKIEEVVPTEDVEVVVINEEDTSTPSEEASEYPYFFTATEEEIIDDKEENDINDNKQNYGEILRAE